MKKLNEIDGVGSGVIPESPSQPQAEPVEQDQDLTDFYAACGLKGSTVEKIVKRLMGYFEADMKKVIPGVADLKEDPYIQYFLQYLGDYLAVMKDPKEAKRIEDIRQKQEKKQQLSPEDEKFLNDWIQRKNK